jgi:hypothetical protein
MATKKTIRRTYTGSDSYTLENGQTLHDLFVLDLAEFIAKLPELDDPFAQNWQDAIDAAINYTDDSVILGQIAPQTLSVTEAMKAGKEKYNEVIFYAAQHFGKNSPVLKEFGKGKAYDTAIRSQEKMFQFLDELSTTANKYNTQLIAKGYTQAAIDEIATLRNALNANNRAQNLSIKGRPVISEGRTIAYNLAYSYQRKVIDAAQLVYKNNPAKLEQYTYSPPVNHRPAHRLKTTVPAGATRELTVTGIQPPLPENLQPLPHEKVRFSASGSSFTLYVTETPNGPLTEKQLQVPRGKIVSKTIQDILKLLKPGNEEKQLYAYILNTGTAKGTLTITYYPEQE